MPCANDKYFANYILIDSIFPANFNFKVNCRKYLAEENAYLLLRCNQAKKMLRVRKRNIKNVESKEKNTSCLLQLAIIQILFENLRCSRRKSCRGDSRLQHLRGCGSTSNT